MLSSITSRFLRCFASATPATTRATTPSPPPLHTLIPESLTRGKRVLVVGDIHGCVNELQTLLKTCSYDAEKDVLVSVGDIVNKGPDSRGVIQLLKSLNAVVVRGNHDEKARQVYTALKTTNTPIPKPALQWVASLTAEEAAFLEQLPCAVTLEGYNVLIVHAGIIPGRSIQQQNRRDLYTMRDVVLPEGISPENSQATWSMITTALEYSTTTNNNNNGSGDINNNSNASVDSGGDFTEILSRLEACDEHTDKGQPWATVYRGPSHIFFGHDAKRKLQLQPYATGLDCGVVYGGELVSAILPPLNSAGEACVSGESDIVYPPQGGRRIGLGTGMEAYLVSVKAMTVHSPPVND